ncbi:MAG: hypothetical protein AAF694_31005, partial [Bacteroidota bacterium]
MSKTLLALLSLWTFLGGNVYSQVCDDIILKGCESSLSGGWIKIDNCHTGNVDLQYCHPRFYVGSGHNLAVRGASMGKIVFDEFIEKTRLESGAKVRKAVGKDEQGGFYTGIFTYNLDNDIEAC